MAVDLATLKKTFKTIENRLDTLDFKKFWPRFKRYPFALYNDTMACFSTGCVPRPKPFMGNTALLHEEEWLAIWYLQDAQDLNRLTALIVHEMFHAHQHVSGESRFPDEMSAVFMMPCDATYLDLKQAEHQALVHALRHQDKSSLETMLTWRKQRAIAYPERTQYESQVEVIEGSAHYVELQALKQLDEKAYAKRLESMQATLLDPARSLPLRPVSYGVGALLLEALTQLKIPFEQTITSNMPTYTDTLFAHFETEANTHTPKAVCAPVLAKHQSIIKAKINAILNDPEWVREGPFKLQGCNVYDAQYVAPYLYSTYFVMLQDKGEPFVEQGTFVCEMADRTVVKLYKMRTSEKPIA